MPGKLMRWLLLPLKSLWRWYRRRGGWMQVALLFPIVCSLAFLAMFGGIGVAIMGTAVGLYLTTGYVIGLFLVFAAYFAKDQVPLIGRKKR